MNYGYARVSSKEQNEQRQMIALTAFGIAKKNIYMGKEFYFILTAAEESVPMMERTVECFRGLLDCLEDPREKGVVYGGGAWRAGDIEGMPAMDEAYAMGRGV